MVLCYLIAAAWLAQAPEPAAPPVKGPRPDTLEAFSRYIRLAEARLDARLGAADAFLWADTPERRARLRLAGVVCEPRGRKGDIAVPHGLIHDWVGAAFLPGAQLEDVLAVLQDYNRHKITYKPEVVDSRLIDRKGNDFKVYLRLLKRKVLTVVMDTEHDVHYAPTTQGAWRSFSRSTRITEVADAGGPNERRLPPGQDHGFLWRLNSYWNFRAADGGVYVECEAVSLSRNVPKPLAWLIGPIVQHLPREALANTLKATRQALAR